MTYGTVYGTICMDLGKPTGGVSIEVHLMKQPQKYLASVDERTRRKLVKALDKLSGLEGDIVKLKGYDNLYRLKIPHYRILFSINEKGQIIIVETINTRTNIKY